MAIQSLVHTVSIQISLLATGMYRLGLTIAPVVAAEICAWYAERVVVASLQNLLSRSGSCIPMPRWKVAVRYYSESRISNLIEHGMLSHDAKAIADKKIELEDIANNFNAEVV